MSNPFTRWRDAPVDAREAIAREQAIMSTSELFAGLHARDDLADVVMPNGKRGADCTPADFREMMDWAGAILKAAREQAVALDLRSATGAVKI
jgi:hypothetical protein